MATHVVGTVVDRRITLEKLDRIAWGLFFLWIGIAFLANLGWGMGLLGIGIIILGGQIAREVHGLRIGNVLGLGGSAFPSRRHLGLAECSCQSDADRLHRGGRVASWVCPAQ